MRQHYIMKPERCFDSANDWLISSNLMSVASLQAVLGAVTPPTWDGSEKLLNH